MNAQLGAVVLATVGAAAQAGVPAEIVGEPIRRVFDGASDDLLSAGLGPEGLRGPAPGFADELAPTPLELRRRAIWTNYRALTDESEAGGFGRLSGPRPGERIAGVEYLAAIRMPDGAGITTVMLQIPAAFDRARPCLVVAAASGSRGIYGALPTAGEWGLRHGCAVAHTDKGAGTGFWDLDSGTGYRIDLAATRDAADPLLLFRPPPGAALEAWRRAHPHRVAVKHAHSRLNVERDWGLYVLQAAKAGIELLNREFAAPGAPRFTSDRLLVIASGISNGGNAVLRAVELDQEGLLDGAVVSEPSAQPGVVPGLRIAMGRRPVVADPGLPLFDFALLHELWQPAAILAPEAPAPFTAVPEAQRPLWIARAAALAAAGDLAGDAPEAQGRDARRRLEQAGILREALDGGVPNVAFGLWPAITHGYTSALARLGVEESPCGLSYAATDAQFQARALTAAELARIAADSAGIPPVAGIQIVDDTGRFASLGSLERLRCMRELRDGRVAAGAPLHGAHAEISARLAAGLEEIRMSARLRGRPVIVLHGRRDALVPVNHTSRAYLGRHRMLREDSLRYYEVEHGHHFDAFNALPGWGERFVPLQPQLQAAMDLMHAHLATGARLAPSQVVRSRPRAIVDGGPEPLTAGHLGAIRANPGRDAIRFRRGALVVPE
ncbi:MAG TPA: 3-hydroxybutyrate oligomer hydrolase family protein [Steroidobacteraceae bacterium]|nr:3-hydroxybutyrate oligomer hydrolase family protein [Steroidobacteraceae bacterium]